MAAYTPPNERSTGRMLLPALAAFLGSFLGLAVAIGIIWLIAQHRLNLAAEQYEQQQRERMNREQPPRLRTLEEFQREREKLRSTAK